MSIPHIMPIETAAAFGLIRIVGTDGTHGGWHHESDRWRLEDHVTTCDAVCPGVVHRIERAES